MLNIKLQQHLPFTVLKQYFLWKTIECKAKLQQHLPFTVLKHFWYHHQYHSSSKVATALTVYGIETDISNLPAWVAVVATALTVYGIETVHYLAFLVVGTVRLQQHLPFTVLKRCNRVS